jgi:DNA-binding NarL/FixJ family response regulator
LPIVNLAPAHQLLLVDDHAVIREGIKHILAPMAHELHITEACDGPQALAWLQQQAFSLVIVDLSMPGMSGLELIEHIKAQFPHMPVLVLSMQAEQQYAMRALSAGAKGYLTKDAAADQLVVALRKLLDGGTYMAPHLAEQLVHRLKRPTQQQGLTILTAREREVLRRFVAGESPTDIALALKLSVKTVSSHKTHIQDKLQLSSMAAMIRYGIEYDVTPGLDAAPDTPVCETAR